MRWVAIGIWRFRTPVESLGSYRVGTMNYSEREKLLIHRLSKSVQWKEGIPRNIKQLAVLVVQQSYCFASTS